MFWERDAASPRRVERLETLKDKTPCLALAEEITPASVKIEPREVRGKVSGVRQSPPPA